MSTPREIASLTRLLIVQDQSKADVMVAIALAESGGNERNLNDNPATRDLSYGLWQINMYGDLGPARRRRYGLRSNSDLFNPQKNAEVAGDIYRTQGLSAWGAYTDGRYRAFMDQAEQAVNEVSGSGLETPGQAVEDILEDPGGALGGVIDAINPIDEMYAVITEAAGWVTAAAGWLAEPHNWIRILEVVGGVALGLVAVNTLAKPLADQATKVAKTVATKGMA